MASKRNRDRLLMVGAAAAAAVSAVAFYFAWKAFSAAADPDDKNEDGKRELQDLEKLMKEKEEKGAEAAGVNLYLEEQDGFTVEEFEQFIAEEYGKQQAKVTVDLPSNVVEEEKFAVEDSIRTEEDQHGQSGGKFDDSEIPCDGFLVGTHLCLTSHSDEIERFSMENELQENNHSVNLICSGPCIDHDVSDSVVMETIHRISNGIPDYSNPLFGDFEGFSSSNPGTPLGQVDQQVEFDNSSNSNRIQGISSEDFVAELSVSSDVGYDELSRQKVVMFLGNGVQDCDLENQSDGKNASEFHQTAIDDNCMRSEGPMIELSDFNDVGELEEHLADDGHHHNHKVAESEESSDVGTALGHEFGSNVNKDMESVGLHGNPSDAYTESSTVGSSEHADCGIATVCSKKPLNGQIVKLPELDNMTKNEKTECPSLISLLTRAPSSVDNICDELPVDVLEEGITSPIAVDCDRQLLDGSLKSVSIKTRDHDGYQIAADSEKSLDGPIVLEPELGNIANNEKMEDLNSAYPVTETSYSSYNGCDGLSSHQLEEGMLSLTATASAPLDCENDTDLEKHLDCENETDLGQDTDGQIAPEIGFDNIINSYNECSGIESSGHHGHQDPAELGKDRTHPDYENDPNLGTDIDGEITPELGFDNIINSNRECSDIDSSDSHDHQYPAELGNGRAHLDYQDPAELGKDRTHPDYENDPNLGTDIDGEITPELGFDNIINSNRECSDIDSSNSHGHQYPAELGNGRAHLDYQDPAESGKDRTHPDYENDPNLGTDIDGEITPELGFDNIINSNRECSDIDSSDSHGHQYPAELGNGRAHLDYQDPAESGKDRTHPDYENDPNLGTDIDGEITPELGFDNIINSNRECSDIDSSDSPGHQYPAELGNDRTHLDCENGPDLGKDTYGEITPELGLDNIINNDSESSGIYSSEHPGNQDHAESGNDRTEQLDRKLNFDSSTNNNHIEDLSLDTESYNSGNMVFGQLFTNLSEDVQRSIAEISLQPKIDSLNTNDHAVEVSRSNSPLTQSPSCDDMGCDSLSGNVFEDTLKSSSVAINGQFDPQISTDLGKQYNGQTDLLSGNVFEDTLKSSSVAINGQFDPQISTDLGKQSNGQTGLLETSDNGRNSSATESLNPEELKSQSPSFRDMVSDEFPEHLLGVMRSSNVGNDTTGDSEKNFGRLNAYDEYLADPSLTPSMKSQVSRARAIAEKLYVSS